MSTSDSDCSSASDSEFSDLGTEIEGNELYAEYDSALLKTNSECSVVPGWKLSPKRSYQCFKRTKVSRRQSSTLLHRRRLAADQVINGDISKLRCCEKRRCFRASNKSYLRMQIRLFSNLSKHERRRGLEQMLRWMPDNENKKLVFCFDGRVVCATFLEKAFKLSRDLQCSVKGTPCSQLSRKRLLCSEKIESQADGRDSIISFLQRLAERTASNMPDKPEKHFPFFKKSEVYVRFIEEYNMLHSSDPPSSSYFYQIWKQHCPSIKVRRVSRFAKCYVCEELRVALLHSSKPGHSTDEILLRRKRHVEMVSRERLQYQMNAERAILQPRNYCSICVDGADQSAFGLPHFAVSTKQMRGRALKVKLVGILQHAIENRLHLYTVTEEFETGANHVIECLHRFITSLEKDGPLPETMYVQLDNCSRENKNRYLLGFLECLVAWGVFKEVHASFLPVGHTHTDIDQSFSCTSRRLRSNDAITLSDLHSELRKSFTPQPSLSSIRQVANFSGLCRQGKHLTRVKNFTEYYYFKFNRSAVPMRSNSSLCKTSCFVKNTSNEQWRPLTAGSSGLNSFLKSIPDVRSTPPSKVVCPEGAHEVELRFRSEEGRVNSSVKMASLRETAAYVFRSREERFHWNLSHCIELKWLSLASTTPSPEYEAGYGSETENDIPIQMGSWHAYQPNRFVAVKHSKSTAACPFWIGKICEVLQSEDGLPQKLDVHWYEPRPGRDVYHSKYSPSYLDSGRKENPKPWRDVIPSDSVVVEFGSLTRQGDLRMAVVKMLRAEFCQEAVV